MPATPPHKTATDSSAWDGPAQEKKIQTPLTIAEGNATFAWRDPNADATTKAAWRFVHHFVSGSGHPGAASTQACSTAVGVLNGGRGVNVASQPWNKDRRAIYEHLIGHLKDAGVTGNDLPELKSARAAGDDCGRCEGEGTIDLGGKTVTCPQCGGTGDGANNADEAKSRLAAKAQRTELRNVAESRTSARSEFELREVPNGTGGSQLRFTGFASVTGDDAAYEMEDPFGTFVESISKGAFQKTIGEGCDTAFLLNHGGLVLARTRPGTLRLSEVTDRSTSPVRGVTGLHSEAMLDPQNHYVQAMRSAVERGDLDEMSMAFRVTRQEWNPPEFDRRRIHEVNLNQGDVSLVTFAASPATGGTVSLRQRRPGDGRFVHLADTERDYELARARMAEMESARDTVTFARARIQLARASAPPPRPMSDAQRRLEILRYPPRPRGL